MTGSGISTDIMQAGKKDPTGVLPTVARTQKKIELEGKRVRRKFGITTRKPQLLEPVKPDPVPTFVETGPFQKAKPKGRKANILAGSMNRRRQILSTKTGGSILQ